MVNTCAVLQQQWLQSHHEANFNYVKCSEIPLKCFFSKTLTVCKFFKSHFNRVAVKRQWCFTSDFSHVMSRLLKKLLKKFVFFGKFLKFASYIVSLFVCFDPWSLCLTPLAQTSLVSYLIIYVCGAVLCYKNFTHT